MTSATLFRPAENDQAFVKALFSGFAGSGKTTAAYRLAKGLIESLAGPGEKIPLLMADTEKGSSYLKADADCAGIPFEVNKTRVFTDLIPMIDEAERRGAVLVIDSLTHFRIELMRALMAANERTTMGASDWEALAVAWAPFSDRFVNSACHIILTARATFDYDEVLDEGGNKMAAKMGTKLKGLNDFDYEPSLTVEMQREPRAGAKARAQKRIVSDGLFNYVGYVMKDRSGTINGKRLVNPGFEDFRPSVECLNLGGKHLAVETGGSSKELFRRTRSEVRL